MAVLQWPMNYLSAGMPASNYIKQIRSKFGHGVLEMPTVCALVYNHEDRVLLMRHVEGGHWSFPGGLMEPYEVPANSLVREVWEETGLVVRPEALVGVFGGPEFSVTYTNQDEVSFVMLTFRARVVGGELRPDGEESLEVGYFSRDQIKKLECSHFVEPVLDIDARRGREAYFRAPGWSPEES